MSGDLVQRPAITTAVKVCAHGDVEQITKLAEPLQSHDDKRAGTKLSRVELRSVGERED